MSCEPLLGPVDLLPSYDGEIWKAVLGEERKIYCEGCSASPVYKRPYCPGHDAGGVGWVICGAETGPGARPMVLDWARSLRDQCAEASVPFFFKRDSAGVRELDGVRWEQWPEDRL